MLANDVGKGKRLNGGQQSGEGVNADLAVSAVASDVVCRFSGARGGQRCGAVNADLAVFALITDVG